MHAESGTAQAVATTAPPGCAAPEQEGSRRARQRLMEALIIKVCASTSRARAAAIKNLQGFVWRCTATHARAADAPASAWVEAPIIPLNSLIFLLFPRPPNFC